MMSSRAHEALDRAVSGQDTHAQALLATLEELRRRSAPERLPAVTDALGDACSQLQAVLSSEDFFAHIGDSFRKSFPKPGIVGDDAANALRDSPQQQDSVPKLTYFDDERQVSISGSRRFGGA